jgi:hypothetical protein
MKKVILNIAIGLLTINSTFAQTEICPNLKLKDGMQLKYFTQTPPPAIYKTGQYYMAKPKEQAKIKENFYKDNPWTDDIQTNIIKITAGIGGVSEIETKVTKTKQDNISTLYYSVCDNDTLISRAGYVFTNNGKTDTTAFYNISYSPDKKKQIGYTLSFDKYVPNKLEVGQTLPDQKIGFYIFTTGDVAFTYPKRVEVSRMVTEHGHLTGTGAFQKDFETTVSKYVTEQVKANIEMTSLAETWLKNRTIKEKKEVTVSDNTYTAYLIREEFWTGGTMWQVKSDNEWIRLKNEKQAAKGQKAVEDLLKKNENANADGYIVTSTETWFILGLGVYAMTSYDSWGEKSGYLELKEIK